MTITTPPTSHSSVDHLSSQLSTTSLNETTPPQTGHGNGINTPGSPGNGRSPLEAQTQAGRGLQNQLLTQVPTSPTTASAAPAPAASAATRAPRTSNQIKAGVEKYQSELSEGERDSGTLRGKNFNYVQDEFPSHMKFKFDSPTTMKMAADGTVDFDTMERSNEMKFSNHFSQDGSLAKMMENYKNPNSGINASDAFFSQLAEAHGKGGAFPASLPDKLPATIVRDTVDGKEARKAVANAFTATDGKSPFNTDGSVKPFDGATELVLHPGDPQFANIMKTVNAKSTQHIVNDFNTLKGTDHAISSIKLTRTDWAAGIKMEIGIRNGKTAEA